MSYPCHHCGGDTIRYGHINGRQRHRCKACDRYSLEPSPNPPGRRPKGNQAMSNAERMRLYRRRKKAQKQPPQKP